MTFDEAMERARIEAWRLISPSSNTHDSACDADCLNSKHYPRGNPLASDEDVTQNLIDFLDGRRR